ncbi:TIGR03936 family radical SAM-associated protein [Eubacteriales bacterium OttesenSCG-928-N13]|nr:TIGR03936 family radical SAM-associated protein [Eubacteriales bacterium OttesenSCG-928-N13]
MRILFEFEKHARLRFISHLDLQRFMQMALRRTNLPVAYSQGFNPHPQMNFASALAMGWTSDCEILDVKMAEDITEDFAHQQMAAALPPDLPLRRVRCVDDSHPKTMAILMMADYEITLAGDGAEQVVNAIPGFLAETEVLAMRKTKSGEKQTDIRPMSVMLKSIQTDVGFRIDARLMLKETATLKPDLLLKVFAERAGLADLPAAVNIHRTKLLGLDQSCQPKDLFIL